MTPSTDMRAELLERLTKATGNDADLFREVWWACVPETNDPLDGAAVAEATFLALLTVGAFTDASLALVERMLPGWWVQASNHGRATVQRVTGPNIPAPRISADAATAPLAILVALLTALSRTEGAEPTREDGLREAAAIVTQQKEHWEKLLAEGKGEFGYPDYVKDDTWTGWIAKRLEAENLERLILALLSPAEPTVAPRREVGAKTEAVIVRNGYHIDVDWWRRGVHLAAHIYEPMMMPLSPALADVLALSLEMRPTLAEPTQPASEQKEDRV